MGNYVEIKKIFSKKIAYELIKRNHDLMDMEDNLKKEGFKVFIFRVTPSLKSDLDSIMGKQS